MAFNDLSLELNEQIATYLDTDQEVCSFRLVCHATNAAIDTYRCGVWRDRYAQRFDMPQRKRGTEIMMRYKLRSRMLRKGAKFLMGQEAREIRCMEVLRDLIVESYANIPIDRKAKYPSKNIEVVQRFVQCYGMLKKMFYCLQEKSNINTLLQTLQLTLTHMELSIPPARAIPALGFAYSQFAVYSHPDEFPMFTARSSWRISTNFFLHIANFFKHHLTQKGENTLYELFSQLKAHEKPKAWNSRLVQGGCVAKLGKHWKGTYAYLHDLHEMDLIRQCEPGKEYFFTDSIDHHDGFQTLKLNFEPQANRAPWPKVFESHLNAMPTELLCNILNLVGKPKRKPLTHPATPKRGLHYQQFSGSGTDAEPFHCSGILHPLPPQEGIPGWHRISMMKYFDPLAHPDSMPPQFDSTWAPFQSPPSEGNTPHVPFKPAGADHNPNDMYQVGDDAEINAGCWAYEGVVLPGGMIMLGRWWSPMDDTGLKRCMGPFIFWNVDKDD